MGDIECKICGNSKPHVSENFCKINRRLSNTCKVCYNRNRRSRVKESNSHIFTMNISGITYRMCPICNKYKNLDGFRRTKNSNPLTVLGCTKCMQKQYNQRYYTPKRDVDYISIQNDIEYKKCTSCQCDKEHTREHFHYVKVGGFKLTSECIKCHNTKTILHANRTKDSKSEYDKKYYNLRSKTERQELVKLMGGTCNNPTNNPYSFYILKFTNQYTQQTFLKIGITKNSIRTRFSMRGFKDYKIEELGIVYNDYQLIKSLEQLIKNELISEGYQYDFYREGLGKINGYTECFEFGVSMNYLKKHPYLDGVFT